MKKYPSLDDRALLMGVFFLDIYNRNYVNGEVTRTATQIKCLWTLLSVSFISFAIAAGVWVGDVPETARPIIVIGIFFIASVGLSWLAAVFLQERRIAINGKLMKARIINIEVIPNYNETAGVRVHYKFVSPSGRVFQKREEGPNTPSFNKIYTDILILYVNDENFIVL